MAAAGVELLAHVDQLAVMGFAEVIRHLPYFIELMNRVQGSIRERRPDLIIPIDYPGFNLRLAKHARRVGVPVLYYIAPQVWAWHRSRMRQLAQNADRLAVILPFEESLFTEAGAQAVFVGHPLADQPPPAQGRAEFAASLHVAPDRPLLALFPGSRAQEVDRQMHTFAAAAEAVCLQRPDVQPVIATSAAVPPSLYSASALPRTEDGDTLLHHATAALVKSGTSTLQAALAGTPMVVTYRMHPLTYLIARRLVRVPHVGLVNLVAGERVVPELLQGEATPANLAAAVMPLLDESSDERRRVLDGLERVRTLLAPADPGRTTADRVTELAAELVSA